MRLDESKPWIANLFVDPTPDGHVLTGWFEPRDQDWLYQVLSEYILERELCHRWRVCSRADWGRGAREVWSGCDWWLVEESLVNNVPAMGELVVPSSLETIRLDLACDLALFGPDPEPTHRAYWGASAVLRLEPGRHEIEMRAAERPGKLPFQTPEPALRPIERDTFERWSAELKGGDDPGSIYPFSRGWACQDPKTGRVVSAEPIASEELGSPVCLVAGLGPDHPQALILGVARVDRMGFVPEGVFIEAGASHWLITPGSPVAERLIML